MYLLYGVVIFYLFLFFVIDVPNLILYAYMSFWLYNNKLELFYSVTDKFVDC